MRAILELEQMGFTFTLDSDLVRYAHHGDRPESKRVRPLLEYLRRHRDEAVRFLRERAAPMPEVDTSSADDSAPGCPITLIWPADIQGVGVIEGQWRRLKTGEIEARYPNRHSLAQAIAPALSGYDGCPELALKLAEALQRWPDDPPPMTPCRPFETGEHRRFWRRLDKWATGWICAICHPPPPGVEVETWEVPI